MTWLPEVCNELHGEFVTLYWLMILPLTVLLIMLEFFKTEEKEPNATKVLTRAVISIVLLVSFKETINLIAFIGDGISSRIDGLTSMEEVATTLLNGFSREAPTLYKIREAFIFLLNFVSYVLAYFGIFIANALIHFVWSILYVCAPLMILCHIPESTANVCKNLYKGLLTVISWKLLWSILSILLLKLAAEQTTENSDNAINTAIINLSIALSILFIPFFSKSLIGDGLSGVATGIAGTAGAVALKTTKMIVKKSGKKGWERGKERFLSNDRERKQQTSNLNKNEVKNERSTNQRG